MSSEAGTSELATEPARLGQGAAVVAALTAPACAPTSPAAKSLSKGSLTKKASLNSLAAVLDLVARTVVELVINPLLLSGLGDSLFGVWRVLWRLVGSLSVASGRTGQVLKFAVASRQGTDNVEEKRYYVTSALVVWVLFLPLVLVSGACLVYWVPYSLHLAPEYWLAVRWATGLLVVSVAMVSLLDVPRAILQGENLGYKRMGLSTLLVGLEGGLMALALYFNAGIVGVAVANLIATTLTGFVFLHVARKCVPWLGVIWPQRSMIKWFFGLSWWFILWKLVMQVMMAGDVVLLGMQASLELVTVFSLSKYVPETMPKLVALVVTAVSPGLGGLLGAKEYDRAAKVRGEIMTFTWLLLTVTGAAALMWNRPFIELWVGNKYDAGVWASLLITLLVFQLALIRTDANVIDLTLDVRLKVTSGLISTAISLALAAGFLCMGWGIEGMCLGLILGRLPLSFIYPAVVGNVLGSPLTTQLRSVVRPVLATAVVFALAIYAAPWAKADNWLMFIAAASATGLLAAVLTGLLGLTGVQRATCFKRFKKVVRFS